MPQMKSKKRKQGRQTRPQTAKRVGSEPGARYTVGLPATVASQVERYAASVDTSMSKAIAVLVRLGLESQASRKREFFDKLKENLDNDDPGQKDRLVDEFRALILGR